MNRRSTLIGLALVAVLGNVCCLDATALKQRPDAGSSTLARVSYDITRSLAHDPVRFTEGLEWCKDAMLESVGLYGDSALIRSDIARDEILQRHALPGNVFGEGLTCFEDHIYQLTWREQAAVVYDDALQPLRLLHYEGEGWGLTHDTEHLIMSDGSATLFFRNADDFSVVRTVEVHDGALPVTRLNELEYAQGLIFANVWQSDRVALIDPADGAVLGWLDLSALGTRFTKPSGWQPSDDVLNGIAYDASRDRYYFTGKRWPLMFELRLRGLPKPKPPAASGSAKLRDIK